MKPRRQPRTKLVIKVFPSRPKGIWLGKSLSSWLEKNVFYKEFQFSVAKAALFTLVFGALAGWAVTSLVLNYQSLGMARAYKAEADALSQDLRMAQRDFLSVHARLLPIEKRLARMHEVSGDIASVLGVDFGSLNPDATAEELEQARQASAELASRFEHLGSYLAGQRDQLARTPSISPLKEKFWLTSRFGPRNSPFTAHGGPQGGRRSFHSALDLATESGTPIFATAKGTIEFAGRISPQKNVYRSRYGNYIILNHGGGFKTIYAHCKELKVENGQKINRGDLIALVGSTGRSTGPHLHYEVLLDGKAVDPSYYILDLDRDVRRSGAVVREGIQHESELYEAHIEDTGN